MPVKLIYYYLDWSYREAEAKSTEISFSRPSIDSAEEV